MTEEQLAETIRRYWRDRGYTVDVAPVKVSDKPSNNPNKAALSYMAVRSDLLNGWPRHKIKGNYIFDSLSSSMHLVRP